jgi:hypothetical protein
MDAERFEALVRNLAIVGSRRRFGRGLLGAVVAALTGARRARADDAPRLVVLAPPTTGPKLSAIGVEDVTATAATVVWTTSEAADGTVEYGETADLGQAVTDAALVMDHRAALTGLAPATTYHYRVRSRNANGTHATHADRSFVTSKAWKYGCRPGGGECGPDKSAQGIHNYCFCSTENGGGVCLFTFGTNAQCRHQRPCTGDADCGTGEACVLADWCTESLCFLTCDGAEEEFSCLADDVGCAQHAECCSGHCQDWGSNDLAPTTCMNPCASDGDCADGRLCCHFPDGSSFCRSGCSAI